MIKEILKNLDNEITFFSEKNGFDKKEFVIAIIQQLKKDSNSISKHYIKHYTNLC